MTGVKSVPQIGEKGTLTTVVPVINTAGDVLHPFFVCKENRLDQQLHDTVSDKGFNVCFYVR